MIQCTHGILHINFLISYINPCISLCISKMTKLLDSTVISKLIPYLDISSLVAFHQVCFQVREEDFEASLTAENPLFSTKFASHDSWTKLAVEHTVRSREIITYYVIPPLVVDILSNKYFDELLPNDFYCYGQYRKEEFLSLHESVRNTYDHGQGVIYLGKRLSIRAIDGSDVGIRDHYYDSRHGLKVFHGYPASMITFAHSTEALAAVLVDTTPATIVIKL